MVKKSTKIILIALLLVIFVGGGYTYLRHQKIYPSTDDAYIQAHVINIAPRVTGQVSKVYVQNHQFVQEGQRLFDIDPANFQVALDKAIANLDETMQQVRAAKSSVTTAKSLVAERKAELINVEKSTKRTLHLVNEKLYSAAQGDKAESDLAVSKAALAAAQSQLEEAIEKLGHMGGANASIRAAKASITQANLNLKYSHITAPHSGYISNFKLRVGDSVNAFQDVFAIVENDEWWANANLKETTLERIRVGQKATIRVDMYPHIVFHGKVASISAGSGTTFSLLPPENATGNWVKVTQRFPIRIDIDTRYKKYPLRMGSSCEVTVDTSHNSMP
jgi:membrane fusion protein (multidrug efflux system)